MKLRDLSTKNVVSATPDDPVDNAIARMEQHGIHHLPVLSAGQVVDIFCDKQIRHLPVVVDDELLGIVSDRDVRRAFGHAATFDAEAQDTGKYYLGPLEVCEVMTTTVQSVASTVTTRTAIEQMLQHRIHCLAVVDEKLVGVITDTDLLRAIGAADKEGLLP